MHVHVVPNNRIYETETSLSLKVPLLEHKHFMTLPNAAEPVVRSNGVLLPLSTYRARNSLVSEIYCNLIYPIPMHKTALEFRLIKSTVLIN